MTYKIARRKPEPLQILRDMCGLLSPARPNLEVRTVSHFSCVVGWCAGMEEVTARTFVGDAFVPLSDEIQSALTALIEICLGGVSAAVYA